MREPGNEVAVQLAKKSLLSCLLPLSQNKSSWLWNHPYENVFSNTPQVHFHADRTHFWHERFCLRTRFETEVQGNLEVSYCVDLPYECGVCTHRPHNSSYLMGVARIFQRGGHTDSYRWYSSDCHLNIVGSLLTKRLTKGGSWAPRDPPWLRPCICVVWGWGLSSPLSKRQSDFFPWNPYNWLCHTDES